MKTNGKGSAAFLPLIRNNQQVHSSILVTQEVAFSLTLRANLSEFNKASTQKIIPDWAQARSLERVRLLVRLRSSTAFPITVISAAAGFGKTSIVRQFLSEQASNVFIQTPQAASFQKFMREFSNSCATRFPLMLPLPEEVPNASDNIDDIVEIYTAWAITHLRNTDCLFVIDDLQFADTVPAVSMFLTHVIDETKDTIHWLLSSRTRGNLPLTRWQAHGYADSPITADELRMTVEETFAYAELVRCPASTDQLVTWQKQTNGFPVSLTFAIRMSARRGTVDGVFDGTRTLTFEFLADHLWATLAPSDHEFLEVAALAPETHVHHFETAGLTGAARRATGLSGEIAFLSLSADGVFSMHDLFRNFVLQRTQLSGVSDSKARRATAARVLEEAKRYDELLRLHIEDGRARDILDIVEKLDDIVLDHELTRALIDACRGLDIDELGVGMLARQTEHWSWSGDSHRVNIYSSALISHPKAKPRDILRAFRATYRSIYMKPAKQQHQWLQGIEQNLSRLDEPSKTQISAYRASIFARYDTTRKSAQDIIDEIADKLDILDFEDRISTELLVTTASYWLGNKAAALNFARNAVSTASASGDLRQEARTLNNLGIMLLSDYDSELESLFEPSRLAVESTGAWLFCHVSHWFPAFYFALKGNIEGAKQGRALHNAVHPLDDTQRSLFRSVRRHSANLGNILIENYADVIRDSMGNAPAVQADMQYALLVDAAIAHVFISDEKTLARALGDVQISRNKLSKHDFFAVSETVLMEVVCLGANGQRLKARKLWESGIMPAPALQIANPAIQVFLDGAPFIGLSEALRPCKGQPFIGLTSLIIERIAARLTDIRNGTKLTAAEIDVLKLLSLGKSNKAIADARSRSTETVKRQVAAIYKKLGVENRTSALAAAKELGIV